MSNRQGLLIFTLAAMAWGCGKGDNLDPCVPRAEGGMEARGQFDVRVSGGDPLPLETFILQADADALQLSGCATDAAGDFWLAETGWAPMPTDAELPTTFTPTTGDHSFTFHLTRCEGGECTPSTETRVLSSRPDDPATGSATVTAYDPSGRFQADGSLTDDADQQVDFTFDVEWGP